MRYHSVSSGREKDYLVHPHRLAFAQGGLYLLAYVPEYRRHPHVRRRSHRLGVAREADVHAEGAGRDEVFANSLGVHTRAGRARWRSSSLRRWRPTCSARVWHASQQLDGGPGRALALAMDVCHDWALRSWILSWGPLARVLAPERSPVRSGTNCTPRTRYSTRLAEPPSPTRPRKSHAVPCVSPPSRRRPAGAVLLGDTVG